MLYWLRSSGPVKLLDIPLFGLEELPPPLPNLSALALFYEGVTK